MDAKVTVGIPVFNGAATLRRAVESILHQTYRGCIIHISDNCSSDATETVGRALAAAHGIIRYTRHAVTALPTGNFHFLLSEAKTPYFMWLAAEDYAEPSYVERALARLEADPSLVACAGRVRFVRPDGAMRIGRGTYPLLADPVTNLAVFLSTPVENARVYALYRTAPLQRAFPRTHFYASDWAAAGTLVYGKHAEIPEVLTVRDETPRDTYFRAVPAANRGPLARIFPLLPLTGDLLLRQRVPPRLKILKALLYINIEQHFATMAVRHPAYSARTARLREFWRRYVGWRLQTLPPESPGPSAPA